MYRNNYESVGNLPFECDGESFIRTTVPRSELIPTSLISLPEPTWSSYPDDYPISAEEVRTLLWMFSGDISQAAAYYKVPSARLRMFIRKTAYVARELAEIQEQLLDIAEYNIHEALVSNDPKRRDSAARFVLEKSVAGRSRMGVIERYVKVHASEKGPTITWVD
jgi:hypothetical protein